MVQWWLSWCDGIAVAVFGLIWRHCWDCLRGLTISTAVFGLICRHCCVLLSFLFPDGVVRLPSVASGGGGDNYPANYPHLTLVVRDLLDDYLYQNDVHQGWQCPCYHANISHAFPPFVMYIPDEDLGWWTIACHNYSVYVVWQFPWLQWSTNKITPVVHNYMCVICCCTVACWT